MSERHDRLNVPSVPLQHTFSQETWHPPSVDARAVDLDWATESKCLVVAAFMVCLPLHSD